MALVDIGANLAHESFAADFDAMLARAQAAGVETIVVTGSCAASNEQALGFARMPPADGRPRLYATAGLHPHHAADWSPTLAGRIAELARATEVVALGECGLDYFRDLSPRPAQRAAFVAQLEGAIAAGKPVFLHQRDAHDDFAAILREHRAALVDAVVHCFTDTAEACADYLALDCHIGLTGWICDERRGSHLNDVARLIPADRLLIETDAPYLLPRTLRPKPKDRRNEPAYLPAVCEAVAAARGEPPAQVALRTRDNARRFFRLGPAG
ncbi:TatD family hydrolase [Nevskia sp.]|uniref:TatD family hydrolase n=1 Tax=Nevskia sp. TaxID=1929292 RepID=UPI0025E8802E|nr:TatD family hydrolase [Nevskia sp.]